MIDILPIIQQFGKLFEPFIFYILTWIIIYLILLKI